LLNTMLLMVCFLVAKVLKKIQLNKIDEFGKVKKMLQDMSEKLMKEKDVDIKQKDKDMATEKITEFWDDKTGEKELHKTKVVEADTSIKLPVNRSPSSRSRSPNSSTMRRRRPTATSPR
jgi:hypothetical protein